MRCNTPWSIYYVLVAEGIALMLNGFSEGVAELLLSDVCKVTAKTCHRFNICWENSDPSTLLAKISDDFNLGQNKCLEIKPSKILGARNIYSTV